MNWRAGFFRIWIVFAAVWIIAVSGLGYSYYTAFLRSNAILTADCAANPNSGPWCKYQRLEMSEGVLVRKEDNSFPWGEWLVLGVSGPIITLVFGTVIFWIGAGFKS